MNIVWPDLVELDDFLATLSKNFNDALRRNVIPSDWLNTTADGNVDGKLHSRVLGLLAKTGFELDYVVEIESGFTPVKARQFHPDVQLWKSDRPVFLIEYESTNSSDERVMDNKLQHYVDSLSHEGFPEFWLEMYTLPDGMVSNWKSWYHKAGPQLQLIRSNPYRYYKGKFEKKFSQAVGNEQWLKHKLIFLNLSTQSLEVDFPTGLNKKYLFQPPE